VFNIRHVQQAMRGFSNSNSLLPGDDTSTLSPPVTLSGELIGPGKFIPESPECPGNGLYSMGGNAIPELGTLYMTCSLEGPEGHVPEGYDGW
jgi:hypothetical protein